MHYLLTNIFVHLFAYIFIGGFFFINSKTISINAKKYNLKRFIYLNVLYLLFIMLVLFLVCGLRSPSVGVDTYVYVDTFMNEDTLMKTVGGGYTKFEPGYMLYVRFLRLFTDSSQIFIAMSAFITFFGMFIFIKNNCRGSYPIALLFFTSFLYYTTFSGLRQAIAMSVSVNAITYLQNKKKLKAICCVLLGSSFHYTALVLLVLFLFFRDDKWNYRKIGMACVVSLLGYLSFEILVTNVILKLFPLYVRYWESENMMSGSSGVGFLSWFIIFLLFVGLCILSRVKEDSERKEIICSIIGAIFFLTINLLGKKYGIFSRVTRYYMPSVMMLASCIYEKIPSFFKPLVYVCYGLLLGGYFYIIMNNDIYQILPYEFFFE